MNPQDFIPILTAANAGQWLLFTALLVGLIVRLVKINPTIAAAISPRLRAPLALLLGLFGGIANKVVEGTPWKTALMGGALAGLCAIIGHEFVIESIMGGKEIGAVAPKDENGTTGGGGSPYREPAPMPVQAAVVVEAEPKKNETLSRLASKLRARALYRWRPSAISMVTAVVAACFAMVLTMPGCGLFTSKGANSVLDTIQLGCVFSSALTDEKAVAQACGIADDLTPILRQLVGQREAAKRAGVVWHGAQADAGAEAGQ